MAGEYSPSRPSSGVHATPSRYHAGMATPSPVVSGSVSGHTPVASPSVVAVRGGTPTHALVSLSGNPYGKVTAVALGVGGSLPEGLVSPVHNPGTPVVLAKVALMMSPVGAGSGSYTGSPQRPSDVPPSTPTPAHVIAEPAQPTACVMPMPDTPRSRPVPTRSRNTSPVDDVRTSALSMVSGVSAVSESTIPGAAFTHALTQGGQPGFADKRQR